jgi:hypothetical protein
MTDKLTAAGIKAPWPLAMYRRLTCMDASPELRLKWASKAIDALVDLLVQTTNELRLSNRMHTELTDKHTEAAEAENERLREYPTSLCLHLLWHRRNGPPTCFGCGAILRDGRWVSLAEQAAEAATYYEEEADDD